MSVIAIHAPFVPRLCERKSGFPVVRENVKSLVRRPVDGGVRRPAHAKNGGKGGQLFILGWGQTKFYGDKLSHSPVWLHTSSEGRSGPGGIHSGRITGLVLDHWETVLFE